MASAKVFKRLQTPRHSRYPLRLSRRRILHNFLCMITEDFIKHFRINSRDIKHDVSATTCHHCHFILIYFHTFIPIYNVTNVVIIFHLIMLPCCRLKVMFLYRYCLFQNVFCGCQWKFRAVVEPDG